MSTAAQETAAVSLTLDQWRILRTALLSHAHQLGREGYHRLALELVNEIVPALREGGEDRTLDVLEIRTKVQVESFVNAA